MLKVLQRKKHYVKPKIINNETNYWKFALTDTANYVINDKIKAARQIHRSNNNMDIYNISSLSNAHNILNNILSEAKNAFEIHISFEYVFMNKITGEVTVSSPTTKFYFNTPQLIINKSDMINMLRKITDHSIKSELDQLLPNTQSQLMGVYSMIIKILKLSYLIGTCIELPEHIIKSRHIITLDKVENNLCFWAFCALVHGCRRDY